ncbi:MAG: hypothetical protein ABJB05_14680 [Parafilimonas sp.]
MQLELINEKDTLLNQIVKEVKKMDSEEKKKLLIQLRKEEILEKVKNLDSVKGSKKESSMTDEEADDYVSLQRKLKYEHSKALALSYRYKCIY